MMNWKMWQKCVGKMGKKLPIFLFIFILLYVIGSLICYPMLTKRHVLKQKEKYAEQELIMTTFDMSDGESAFLRWEQAAAYQEKSAYEKAGKPSRSGKYYKLPFR